MKKITLACFLLAAIATSSYAQDPERKSNIKVNLISPLIKTFSGFYERKISPSSSLQLGFSYTGAEIDDVQLRGWSVTPEFRYYPTKKGAMEGFYAAPFMRYGNFVVDDQLSKGDLITIGGGLLVGNQWIFAKGISLDTYIGPSYNFGDLKITSGYEDPDFPVSMQGFGVRAGVTLGIAF